MNWFLSGFSAWLRRCKNTLAGRKPYRRPVEHSPSRKLLFNFLEDRTSIGESVALSGAMMAAAGAGAAAVLLPSVMMRVWETPANDTRLDVSLVEGGTAGPVAVEPPPPLPEVDTPTELGQFYAAPTGWTTPETEPPFNIDGSVADFHAVVGDAHAPLGDDAIRQGYDFWQQDLNTLGDSPNAIGEAAAPSAENRGNNGDFSGGLTADALTAGLNNSPDQASGSLDAAPSFGVSSSSTNQMMGAAAGNQQSPVVSAATINPFSGTNTGAFAVNGNGGTSLSATSDIGTNVPVSFEQLGEPKGNTSQFFYAGSNFDMVLASQSATFMLGTPSGSNNADIVSMQFVGANANVAPTGGNAQTVPTPPTGQMTTTPTNTAGSTVSTVSYQNVYSGINLQFYGNAQNQVEYDWQVAAGANTNAIVMQFSGVSQMSLDNQGNLQITTQQGDALYEKAPNLYQTIDGVQQSVQGQYVLLGSNEVGFQVGTYNHAAALTIDPVLTAVNGTLLSAPTSLAAGNTPDSAATLKLDNGQELALIANFYGNSVSVLKSNGDGTFSSLGTLATGSGPNGFAVGDFGNGHQDFAVGNFTDNTVTVYLGDGTGNFTAGTTLSTGAGPANEMAIGDFNGDGKLDLATANQNDGTVSVFLGNGNGTFQNAVNYNVGGGIDCITTGDFTGNGRTDLAVGNFNTSSVTVLSNNGDGTFTVGSPISVGANPWYIASGDFSGDGKDDIATANYYGGVSVLMSNGDGTFQSAVNYAAGSNPTGIVAADLNGDGKLDLVVSDFGSASASVLLGIGDGRFQPAQQFAAGSGPNGLAVGDFNNDGKLDVVVADQNSGSASVLFNTTLQGVEGQVFSGVVGSFTDSNPSTPVNEFTATINWGDGSALDTNTTITTNGNGGFDVSGSHTFARFGSYLIQIYVTDADGDETTISNTVNVADAPLTTTTPAMFGAPITVAAGNTPDSVATLRLDDGQELVLVANFYGNSVSVLQANSNGTFTSLGTLATGSGPNGFAVGDFGNGHQDFAVANFNDSTVTIYLGDGTGNFTAGPTLATGSGPANEMAIGDFNGDGNLDLVTANKNDGTVSVFLGNGNGTFQPAVSYNVGGGIDAITAGDFNADGKTDLAVGNFSNSTVSVLLNNGDGTFTVGSPINVGSNPWYIASGDFNGDGKDDLATANYYGGVSVLLSNGDGTFQSAVNYAAGSNPTGIVAADLNGDGKTDLVVSNFGSNDASILLGNGDGTFQNAVNFTAGSGPNGIAVGDLLDNGKLDIAVADQNSGSATILLNQGVIGTTGQPISGVVASFTDGDPDGQPGDYNATINWGDGSAPDTNAVITANGSGGFDVTGTHTYIAGGNYAVQVTITDVGGGTTTATSTAHVNDPANGTGTVTINAYNNSTPATVTFNDGTGLANHSGTEDTLLTQFNVTYNSGPGMSMTFDTFCNDLFHNVTLGQTYAVGAMCDEATAYANGSRMSYIFNIYGVQDLSSDPIQAAAVQLALWDLSLNNHNPTSFGLDGDGTYSSGDESVFSVNLGSNPNAGAIASLVNQYLVSSGGVTTAGSYLKTLAGSNKADGQTLEIPMTYLETCAFTAQVRTSDPVTGDALSQKGTVTYQVALNTSQSPNQGCSCSCSTATGAANEPTVTSGLMYNSDQVSAQPIVQAQVTTTPDGPMPTSVDVQLTWNGIAQPVQTLPITGFTPGATLNVAAQVANPVTQTGRYGWSLTLTFHYDGYADTTCTASGATFVVAQDASTVGAGWSFGMVDRLIPIAADSNGPAGVLRDYGTGGDRFYQSTGNGTFASPPGDNGTLVQNADGSYTYADPAGVTWDFNPAGEETSEASTCGCTQYTFSYDSSGNLASMTSTDGAVSTFNYSSGLLSSITVAQSASGPVMRTYDITHTGDDLTGVTNPDGSSYSFSYDSSGHLTNENLGGETSSWTYADGQAATIQEGSAAPAQLTPADTQGLNAVVAGNQQAIATDPNGNTTTTVLDGEGRQLQQTDALGGVTTWVRNANGYVTSMTDPLGHVTNDLVDAQGYTLQTTYADGSTEEFQYNDPHHNLTSYTDQNGNTTTYTWDNLGHMLSQTDALGNTTTYTYANDLLATMTDPNGGTTQYSYDSHRRLIKTIDAIGNVTTTTYDANGFVASTTDANGNTTTYVNDPMGRVLQQIDPLGNTWTSTYDANGNVLTDTDPLGHTTQHIYNDRGLEVQTIDALGNSTYMAYDAADNLIADTDANGHTTHFVVDALNRQVETIDPLGNVTQTGYNADGNVISATDANGNTTQFVYNVLNEQVETIDPLNGITRTAYDAAGNVISTTDANGNTTTYGFDADNREVATTDPLDNISRTGYDANGNVTSTTDANGNTTTYGHDADNRVTSTTDSLGFTTHTGYDAAGNVISTTDANGHTTTYGFDADNRETSTTDPLGFTTHTGYDAAGNMTSTTDANGNTTTYGFDADNRETSTTDPLGFTTHTGYDAAGNMTSTTDANGNTTTYGFDADNRETSTTDPLGFTTHTGYDANGNVISTTDANNYTTTYGYDADNRETSTTDPLGFTTHTAYDAAGNVISTTDANGHTTTFGYDADNRETAVTDALGHVTTTEYDHVGNVIAVTDSAGNTTTYSYNAKNEQVSMTDPLNHTETYAYDGVGNLVSTTDRDGRLTNNTYDADNRLIQIVWLASDGVTVTDTKTYTYDANGNMLSATDNTGTYTMTYDADSRLVTQTDPFGLTLTYGYDANGTIISVQDSLGGLTSSVYDADNRLVSRHFMDGSTQLRIDLAYDGNGNILTETRYADLAGTQKVGSQQDTYDADNRVTEIVDKDASANVIEDFQSSYDAGGRLTTETDNGVSVHYTYDATNQLLGDGTNTYSYDPNGNRTDPGYVTGPSNQLLSDGTWNYSYDNEGNLIQKVNIATGEKWTYGYNNANQMISAVDQAAANTVLSQETITYDVFGNRIEQAITTTGTAVSRYAYDGMNVWADLDGTNALQTRRVFLDSVDQVSARITASAGATAWYLTDRQGSIRGLTDGSGNLQDQITYDGFGNVLSETDMSFGDRYKYTGQEFDRETGLQYNRARYYDANTGRWTSQDAARLILEDSNLYRYVNNDPTNYSDPFGFAGISAATVVNAARAGWGQVLESRDPTPEEKAKNIQFFNEDAVVLRFNPALSKKVVCCDEIVHVQVLQVVASKSSTTVGSGFPIAPGKFNPWAVHLDVGETPDHHTVDRTKTNKTPVLQDTIIPWGPEGPQNQTGFKKNDGTTRIAVAIDAPSFANNMYDAKANPTGWKSVTVTFEAFPGCRKGLDAGKLYDGGVIWEFYQPFNGDAVYKVIRNNVPEPSSSFLAAYEQFKRATGVYPLLFDKPKTPPKNK